MRRDKICERQKFKIRVYGMTREQLCQLDEDLRQQEFRATVDGLHGAYSGTFYCSSFSANRKTAKNDNTNSWEAEAFTITEC